MKLKLSRIMINNQVFSWLVCWSERWTTPTTIAPSKRQLRVSGTHFSFPVFCWDVLNVKFNWISLSGVQGPNQSPLSKRPLSTWWFIKIWFLADLMDYSIEHDLLWMPAYCIRNPVHENRAREHKAVTFLECVDDRIRRAIRNAPARISTEKCNGWVW